MSMIWALTIRLLSSIIIIITRLGAIMCGLQKLLQRQQKRSSAGYFCQYMQVLLLRCVESAGIGLVLSYSI